MPVEYATKHDLEELGHTVRTTNLQVMALTAEVTKLVAGQERLAEISALKRTIDEKEDTLRETKRINEDTWLRFHVRMVTAGVCFLAVVSMPQLVTLWKSIKSVIP